jgi:tRNA(fMet)-specific endonuclease VapC
MSFLLDTDTVSFHLKRPRGLIHRFTQYSGRLYLSSIALAELYVWAFSKPDPVPTVKAIQFMLRHEVNRLDFDDDCALKFGETRAQLLPMGIVVSPLDLLLASVALTYGLTLVTHNISDFQAIPGLRLEDWISP